MLRQLKVLKQRAREHLAALHAEKQMLEEQAAAATRRLREHEDAHAALHAKLKAAEERLAAMAASFKAAEEIQTRVAAEREAEHAALLDERAGRRAAEEGRRRSEEAAAALRDEKGRLVAKCDVPGIMAVFERWDVYDVDTLSALLASSFADLQRDLAPVAALSFLALLKATIGGMPSAPPHETPSTPAPAKSRLYS